MLNIFVERLRQKMRTVGYPEELPSLPPRFRGRPAIDAGRCRAVNGAACETCKNACPVGAVSLEPGGPVLDMGVCTFCGACALACDDKALLFTTDWRIASTSREALRIRPLDLTPFIAEPGQGFGLQSLPEAEATPLCLNLPALPVTPFAGGGVFQRSFRLRQVSAAGCGACEADLNVLGTVVFDLGRFGIDFVASPRHADALVVTGPVPRNMKDALMRCDNATPRPRAMIAVGACGISGGLFRDIEGDGWFAASGQQCEGTDRHLPVDLFIPGCPPHPYTNLDGFLRFLGLDVPGG